MHENHWHWIVTAFVALAHLVHLFRSTCHSGEVKDLRAAFDWFVGDTRRRLADHGDSIRDLDNRQAKHAEVHNALVGEFREDQKKLIDLGEQLGEQSHAMLSTLEAHRNMIAAHERKLSTAPLATPPRRGRPPR